MNHPKSEDPVCRIKEIYEQLHKKERVIADVLISHSTDVIYDSTKEMSKRCGCSESSIVRFCQALGYSGFSALKIELAKQPSIPGSISWFPQDHGPLDNSLRSITNQLCLGTSMIFSQLPRLLNYDALNAAIQAVSSTKLLLINGYLYSGQIAAIFGERIKGLGIPVLTAWDHIQMKQNTRLAGQDSVSLFLSHSGSSKESIENAEKARERQSTLIVLTTLETSPLAKLADILLLVPLSDKSLFEYYYPTEYAFQAVLSLIHTEIARIRNTSSQESASNKEFENEIFTEAIMSPVKE